MPPISRSHFPFHVLVNTKILAKLLKQSALSIPAKNSNLSKSNVGKELLGGQKIRDLVQERKTLLMDIKEINSGIQSFKRSFLRL